MPRCSENPDESMVMQTGGIFHPLVVESPHVIQILKTIARRASFQNNISIGQSVCNLHQQLSTKLWLCNARMVLERLSLDCSDSPF